MAINRVVYATREDVKSALDFAETARNNGRVDRALVSASGSIERLLRRKFYPETDTRVFDWPDRNGARPWRLWLGADELISVTTLTAAGTAIAATDFFLEPANSGPPFNRVEIDLASSASFSAGDTHQRAISIAGVFGGTELIDEAAGSLENAIADTTTTTVDVTDSAVIGVGDLIKVDTERMIVTGKTMLDTTQNTGGALTASTSDVTVPVTNGAAYIVGETILVDSERMLIVDIAGNNLTVKRAYDGTALAAHSTGADIYAPRRLTVTRGAVGTTAATHLDAAAVTRHVVPGPVRSLCIAETLVLLKQEQSGYAAVVGEGDDASDPAGAGLEGLRATVRADYGRRLRMAAI